MSACISNYQYSNDMEVLGIASQQYWDKTFEKSPSVKHEKVSFTTQYGQPLSGGLYLTLNASSEQGGTGLGAIAVCEPFGAVKELCSGLYAQAYASARFLNYINEIRSAVLLIHGEKAHSRYFSKSAYHYMIDGKANGYTFVAKANPSPENKHLLIAPGTSLADLYDGGKDKVIPWDKLTDFFTTYLE